jgi:hypothetical protein
VLDFGVVERIAQALGNLHSELRCRNPTVDILHWVTLSHMVVHSSSAGASRAVVRRALIHRLGLTLIVATATGAVAPRASASDGPDPAASAEPARGTYVRVPPADFTTDPAPQRNGQPHVLYLNRCEGGQTVTSGWPDDSTVKRSGILYGTVHFPPYPYGDASWQQVVEHTREIFAPFNIAITDIDPSPSPHDAAIVCGSGGLAGFHGAGGVAPFTCGVITNPITFTFPESLGNNARVIAEVIAQEAAHAWGLDHSYKCEDPMTYLSGCGPKSFQDGSYPCGEYSPRSCECGGSTQNTFAHIMALFGPAVPDLHPPTVAITYPQHGQVFEAGSDFEIRVKVDDDVGVTLVSLEVNAQVVSQDTEEPFGPWPVVDIPEGVYELQAEASDASGKTGVSGIVRIEVTADGMPPDDDDGVDSQGGGGPHPDGGTDDDAEDPSAESGALPPGFGPGDEAGPGCTCATGPSRSTAPAWLVVGLIFGLIARRRPRPRVPDQRLRVEDA